MFTRIIILGIILCISLVKPRNFREVINLNFERAVITHCDEKYITNCSISVTKKSRKEKFLLNIDFYIVRPLMENVTFRLINYEFRSNVYKEDIIRIDEPVCIAMNNPFLRAVAAEYSNVPEKCPISGHFYFHNMSASFKKLPLDLPNSQQRFDVGLYQNQDKKIMIYGELYVKIEHTIVRVINKIRKKP